MNWPLRNTVLVLAIVGFASMASGLTLQLHLAGAENSHHHNSADCTLCHAMLLGAAKFHLEAQSTVVPNDNFGETVPEIGEVLSHHLTTSLLGPRSPPICAP